MSDEDTPVRWAQLRPDTFRARRDINPVVYLPLGLCEPHGCVAALGLDLIKAEYYCDEAARRFGGIVAPAQGYHIHECGFHAPWLAEVVGEDNALMAAIPPHVMLHLFLYQLRTFANAGFKVVIAVSGHAGGSQEDLRRAAAVFAGATGLRIVVRADPEWVEGLYIGDHAGKYELSQLLAMRPDLVDLSLLNSQQQSGTGGRFALGDDAADASADYGHAINEAIIAAIGSEVSESLALSVEYSPKKSVDYTDVEALWAELRATMKDWRSLSPHPGQASVASSSQWHSYAHALDTLKND